MESTREAEIFELCKETLAAVSAGAVQHVPQDVTNIFYFTKFLGKAANLRSWHVAWLNFTPAARTCVEAFRSPAMSGMVSEVFDGMMKAQPAQAPKPQHKQSASELREQMKYCHPDKGGDVEDFIRLKAEYDELLGGTPLSSTGVRASLPQDIRAMGTVLFVSKGSEQAEYFDLLVLGDSLGYTKSSKKASPRWFLQDAADAISNSLGISVCTIACPGAGFATQASFEKLLAHAPGASSLLIISAGNDFVEKKRWEDAVVKLRMAVLGSTYSRRLAIVGGSSAIWHYNDSKFNHERDECIKLLGAAMRCVTGVSELKGLRVADAVGHACSDSKPQLIDAWVTWAELAYNEQRQPPQTVAEPSSRVARVVQRLFRHVRGNITAMKKLAEAGDAVYVCCENCTAWRKAVGLVDHLASCLGERALKHERRCLAFAVAQIQHPVEAWKIYKLEHFVIPDSIAAACPKNQMKMLVYNIARGTGETTL